MAPRQTKVQPRRVRYIKLGAGGGWEQECLNRGIIRFGFGTDTDERFPLCRSGRWDTLTQSFLTEKHGKSSATRFTNETRLFFEDDGTTLWITFVGERLYWGFLTGAAPERHADGDGVWRTVAGGWRSADLNGDALTKDRLSGSLTKLVGYRGTSCSVDVADYAIRRINGEKIPEVERGLAARLEACNAIVGMLRLLGEKDFETLVDLVFSTSGWRRLGPVGRTQKTLDLDLTLPSTGERAFVQVKSRTKPAELAGYAAKAAELGPYDRMFFVFHTGKAEALDDGVTVIGPDKLADLVLDSGLMNWVINKVS